MALADSKGGNTVGPGLFSYRTGPPGARRRPSKRDRQFGGWPLNEVEPSALIAYVTFRLLELGCMVGRILAVKFILRKAKSNTCPRKPLSPAVVNLTHPNLRACPRATRAGS